MENFDTKSHPLVSYPIFHEFQLHLFFFYTGIGAQPTQNFSSKATSLLPFRSSFGLRQEFTRKRCLRLISFICYLYFNCFYI